MTPIIIDPPACVTADVVQDGWAKMAAEKDVGATTVILRGTEAQALVDLLLTLRGVPLVAVTHVMVYRSADRSAAVVLVDRDGCAFAVVPMRPGEYDGVRRLMSSGWSRGDQR
jgi:hypothetical protein